MVEIIILRCVSCRLYNSVDTVDFGIQVLVVGVVRGLSEAVGRHTIALAHGGLALVVGGCRDGDRVREMIND